MKASLLERATLFALVTIIVVVYVFPYAFLVSTSLKPPADALAIPPTILPQRISLENYRNIATFPSVRQSFGNSLTIALLSTLITISLAVPAAYAVARFASLAGKIFLIAVLITRLIPPVSVGIPLFAIMRSLDLTDTHIGVALAHSTISVPLAIWLLASFMESIPHELEEAARVDGCSRFGALFRIIIPVAAGGIAVTSVFVFLASWNEFLFAFVVIIHQRENCADRHCGVPDAIWHSVGNHDLALGTLLISSYYLLAADAETNCSRHDDGRC